LRDPNFGAAYCGFPKWSFNLALRFGASMVCNQMEMDTHTFLHTGVSSEVQQSGMDDDGSLEGDFILPLPIAAFKVFGTA
jgi:hypothetical protein